MQGPLPACAQPAVPDTLLGASRTPCRGRVTPPHTQCSADLAVKQSIHPRDACSPASWSTLAVSEHLGSTPDIMSLSVPDLIVLCVQQGATTYKIPAQSSNPEKQRWRTMARPRCKVRR